MSWNGSGTGGGYSSKTKKSVKAKQPLALGRGLLAGLIVVAFAAVAAFFLLPGEKPAVKVEEPETAKRAIADHAPAEVAPVVEEVRVEKPKRPKRYWEEDVMPDNLSPAQQRKWRHAHRPPPGYTNDTSRTEAPPKYAIFEHPCENTIAGYLTMTPGETLVGTPRYGKKFTQQFLESLKTPIIVTKDDTPEQAELKNLMIATKIDLKARHDAGEDIGKILEDTHEEYQRLASLKSEIQREFNEFRKSPEATVEDVEDFLSAANRILEQKGVAPLTMSPIAKRMLMRRKGVQP